MAEFSREEMDEMVRRWVKANRESGEAGDWSAMADFYTEDALYSWNIGSDWEFVARGREQILDWAFRSEMAGLEHWSYPYVRTLVDDRKGEFVGFWRQVAPVKDPDGTPYEIVGTGGSWFRYAGDFKWAWQRDWFDHTNAGVVFGEMSKNGQLPPAMEERLKRGSDMPGWTRIAEFDWYSTIQDPEA
jgi:hypothetical protein